MNPQYVVLYLILGFIGFKALLWIYYPFFVLVHEFGHALPAIIFRNKQVEIHIGKSNKKLLINTKPLKLYYSSNEHHSGYTSYIEKNENILISSIIILTAPLISILLTIAGIILWKISNFQFLTYFLLTPAWLANFHITINAIWPFAHPDNQAGDISPQSDICKWMKLVNTHK